MIVHTSGTTGAPKAAVISHAMEIGRIDVLPPFFRYAPGDRLASLVPPEFRVTRSVALKCLSMGGTFVAMPRQQALAAAIDLVERERVDVLMATPSQLVDLLPDMPRDRPRLPMLRVLRTTAGAMPPALVAEVRARISPNLHVDYGTNDAGSIAVATPADLDRDPRTVGRPFAGLELEIVDAAGAPLPPDVEGEIRLRGPGVSEGYIGDPEATRRSFRAGWFHPGDRGRIDRDGLLYVTGRVDDLMNVAGRKIAPAEIEAVLAEHPAVAEVVAFALDSLRDQHVPVASVVLRPGVADPSMAAQLRQHGLARLGPHAPRVVHVVPALPRDRLGKVSRRKLAAMMRAAQERQSRGGGRDE
jgi:acyl-coenzyme A synthetase/AMP-(fatty) acid ligase